MEKNKLSSIIQALVIAAIVFFGFQFFMHPKKTENNAKAVENTKVIKVDIPSVKTVGRTVKVETPLYTAAISTVNGRLVNLYVKKYKAQLVSPSAEKLGIYPLTTISDNKDLTEELLKTQLTPDKTEVKVTNAPVTLTLTGTLKDGTTFTKTLTFYPNSYKIDVKTKLQNKPLITVVGPDIKVNEAHTSRMGHIGPVLETADGKVIRLEPKDIKGSINYSHTIWAGEEDKYFIMALRGKGFPVTIENLNGHTLVKGFIGNFIFYGGPKELKQLEALGMDKAIDFGIFGFLAKPLLKFFLFLHQYIHNWGLVIIVLTLIIKILLHPLTHKGFESMKKMQELAPKLEELKKRYKNDPQKLNEEMMKLYKEAGVNPMGGCLPMLLQIPIFFALYEIFLNAVELKGASFLWVPDLSMHDPTYIMPVLMGASMILQQKLTPTANPEQQKIFYIMAVVFTFMFATFPAGLVLYWLTNNLITAIQNLIIHEMIKRKSA
jgi:YidC/Oxa1 family membrane protein insertase